MSSPAGDGARCAGRGACLSIQLSQVQVDAVARAAAQGESVTMLLSGRPELGEIRTAGFDQLNDRRLSRSLLAGLLMLMSFPTDGSYVGNAELARTLDMNASTTHRYLSTLVAVGLVERDPDTRRCRLPR